MSALTECWAITIGICPGVVEAPTYDSQEANVIPLGKVWSTSAVTSPRSVPTPIQSAVFCQALTLWLIQ